MWQAIISGVTLGCILALSVGPVIFTIIKQSLVNGHTGGFSFVAGVWLSDIVMVVVANAFSQLVAEITEYTTVIAYCGAAFLLLMGIYYLFFKKVALRTDADGQSLRFSKREMMKIFSSGFLINTLNPSVLLFWITTATAFAAKYTFNERILLFSVCIAFNIVADVAKVLLAGRLGAKLTINNISIINKVTGVILVAFGFALLYTAIFVKDTSVLTNH
ncbi:LysE family translocator [Pseudobacter ginsenosidimutans]|uniref:Threonine/homoserine/homoserine lactone efflux protein n=1 Tax=Pseudobacter ginsenosidimutans TaxID=661488 RepID=A0A4Q7MSN5_9BACT|nr:LysE family translocator [Pseudobacter ginsenosidimutans]QEC41388.1 LysE family translocator [Pseudobacter ginsenosidimutans]RZS71836.1 threonine/homoserine/homoserine lactone efflux protein [Pseudobacter ginsenosidimutans]